MKPLSLLVALLAMTVSASAFGVAPLKTVTTTAAPLKLETRLSHKNLPSNSTTEIYATVRVTGGPAQDTGARSPLNVALVIDRSTSMAGGRLEQAKHASIQFVRTLQSTDRLAIVSYGSDVSTVLASMYATPANKEEMELAIQRIELSGATNLSGGLERGVELIAPHNRDETINRLLLLSDGHANNGITSVHGLADLARKSLERGVSISTMGIGLDYNEELMTQVATNGAGNYYFVENENALASIFEKECKGLTSTVARKTVLTLDAGPGVEILDVQGFAFSNKGNRTTVRLAEFYANQSKDLLVRMSVTTGETKAINVLTTKIAFDDVVTSKRTSLTRSLEAGVTADKTLAAKAEKEVMQRVQQAVVAKNMEEAMKAYERGESQRAAEIVRAQKADNVAKGAMYDFADDQAFGRVNKELDELESTVQAAPAASTEGKRSIKAKRARAYEIQQSAASF
jgi:Ca-activated chloride channel family protein